MWITINKFLSEDNFENTTFHISCKIKGKLYFTLRINNHRGKGQKLVGLWQTGPLLVRQFSNIFCRFRKKPALYLWSFISEIEVKQFFKTWQSIASTSVRQVHFVGIELVLSKSEQFALDLKGMKTETLFAGFEIYEKFCSKLFSSSRTF